MITQPKDHWYYGWNIVAAATLLTMLTVGMRMSIGPFFLPMLHDLNFSRSLLSTIIAVGMLCYGLGMPLVGYLVNKWGTRTVLILGTVIVSGSSVWTVYAKSPLNFFIAFGIVLSVGLAFTSPVALTPILSRWFTRQRGMALFFLSTGSMAGIAVMTPVFTYCIEQFGWHNTLIGYAILFALLTIPTAQLIIRDDAPEHTDLLPEQIIKKTQQSNIITSIAMPYTSIKQALSSLPFWQISLGLFACGFSMNLLGTHGLPMLIDHGFSDTLGSLVIGLLGFVAILGTLILGRLADIFQRRYMLAVIYFIRGIGFMVLVAATSPWQLFMIAAICGLVWSGSVALSSAILADVYGVRLVGMLYGLAYLSHQVGAMLSSWLGGFAYEYFHTHALSFNTAGVLLIIAAFISLRLPKNGIR